MIDKIGETPVMYYIRVTQIKFLQETGSDRLTYIQHLSNRPHFLCVYRHDNPRGMLGEDDKSLYIVKVGYHASKPIESVVYCFYKITLSFL